MMTTQVPRLEVMDLRTQVNQAYLGLASWAGVGRNLQPGFQQLLCQVLLSNVHDSVIDMLPDETCSYPASKIEEVRCSQEPGFQHAYNWSVNAIDRSITVPNYKFF